MTSEKRFRARSISCEDPKGHLGCLQFNYVRACSPIPFLFSHWSHSPQFPSHLLVLESSFPSPRSLPDLHFTTGMMLIYYQYQCFFFFSMTLVINEGGEHLKKKHTLFLLWVASSCTLFIFFPIGKSSFLC